MSDNHQEYSPTYTGLIWRESEHVCAVSDDERHLGHIVLRDRWNAYDATKLNAAANGFKCLGEFDNLMEAKDALERSIAAAPRAEPKTRNLPVLETSKEICRRLREDGFGRGDVDVIHETVSPACLLHDPVFPSLQVGSGSLMQHIDSLRRSFPDLSCVCDDVIAEGDEVVIHWTSRGTHRGEFLNYPATNSSFMISGTSIHRLEEGRIVELWADWNLQSLMDQLGLGMKEHEAHKALVRRFVKEVWNRKQRSMISHFVTADSGLIRDFETQVAAMPDCHWNIVDAVCEGDRVILRFIFSGTPAGGGQAVSTPAVAFFRLAKGKITAQQIVWAAAAEALSANSAPQT